VLADHPRRVGRSSTAFLQAVTVLVGLGVLFLLLLEPQVEGKNADATFTEIYLRDPFVLFVYVGSIPFFIALFQAFKLLGYVGSDQGAFSARSVRAARLIRECARVTIGFVAVGVVVLMFVGDERTLALFLGLLPTFGLLTLCASAALLERLLQRAVDLQTDNDLTV
jgi:hypothetical protein